MKQNNFEWKELGEFVEAFSQKCGNSSAKVSGVNINKEFIATRALMDDIDTSKYYLVPPKYFACNLMHIGRDERLPIAYNDTNENLVVTSAYYVFRIKEEKKSELLTEYLYMYFNSPELDRLTWFYTDSSVRGNLKESRFLDIKIPIPYKDGKIDVARQKQIVDVYKGLKKIKEQNLAIAEPLFKLCQSYIQELKKQYEPKELGEYIEETNERNIDNELQEDDLLGVNKDGEFIVTRANTTELKFTNYKIVNEFEFAYSNRINLGSIALRYGKRCIVSASYATFKIIDHEKLLPEFLAIWFRREEFLRSTLFYAYGTIKDDFSMREMSRVKLPIPPLEKQKAIVDIYKCAKKAKEIAQVADTQSRLLCPVLFQMLQKEN